MFDFSITSREHSCQPIRSEAEWHPSTLDEALRHRNTMSLLSKLELTPPPIAATSGTAGPGGPKSASGGAQLPADAMARWRVERQAVVTQLRALAGRANKSSHVKAKEAFIEIQAVVKNLGGDPHTVQQVDELERWLREDAVVGDIDDLALPIRSPLLAALSAVRATIQA